MLKGLAGFDNSLFGIRTYMASGRMPGSTLKAWHSWDLEGVERRGWDCRVQ